VRGFHSFAVGASQRTPTPRAQRHGRPELVSLTEGKPDRKDRLLLLPGDKGLAQRQGGTKGPDQGRGATLDTRVVHGWSEQGGEANICKKNPRLWDGGC
jgi:arginase family enzyme